MKEDICQKCGTSTDMKEEEKYQGDKWVYIEFCPKCGWERSEQVNRWKK